MRWECSECGCTIERPRPPAVCRDCGTAGAIFVEAEPALDGELETDSLYGSWIERGMQYAGSYPTR